MECIQVEEGNNGKDDAIRCRVARKEDIKNIDDFRTVWNSHDWVLNSIENYGGEGLLIKLGCARCDTQDIGILSVP